MTRKKSSSQNSDGSGGRKRGIGDVETRDNTGGRRGTGVRDVETAGQGGAQTIGKAAVAVRSNIDSRPTKRSKPDDTPGGGSLLPAKPNHNNIYNKLVSG
jgi:hypothetical protein